MPFINVECSVKIATLHGPAVNRTLRRRQSTSYAKKAVLSSAERQPLGNQSNKAQTQSL